MSKFITEFNKLLKSSEWISKDEYKKIYHLFTIDKNNNELFLLEKLEEFSIIRGYEFILKFYTTTGFIKYLGENHNFINQKITEKLKEILDFILTQEKPEKYSYTLEIIFSISKNDNNFYISQYEKLLELNKLYHDINEVFLEIFIKLKINDKFILAFQKNIIDNATEVYYFSVKQGFEYLLSLDNTSFKKYFLELLTFFNLKENKQRLIHFHEYTSLIRKYDREDFNTTIKNLINKIENAEFTDSDIVTIKDFIIGDIDFALEHHERNILDNIFINEIFKYFTQQDNHFLLKMLSELKSKYIILSLESLITEYLQENQIGDFIQLYKDTDNSNILYFTYDRLKQSGKINMVELFEKSIIGNEIIKRNKQIQINNKKFEKNKQKELEKEKQNFFKMLEPGKGKYYPKLFQDYAEYIRDKKGLESIFNTDEINKINASIKKQIKVYLEALRISDYHDEKISKILTFEKKQENSYTHTRNSVYLGWIIDISKSIKFDLSKYYTSFILLYPLLWGEEKINDTLEIIGDNINSKDIDYILRVYSEDLHENAKGLRYYHVDTLHDFYEKFKLKFNSSQKKKLENICLDIINGEDEDNIYYKENFLQIYSEIGGEKKLFKLWEQWNTKHQNFNYYKDYLDNNSIDKKEKDSFKFLTFIAKELVKTYQNKQIVLWAINQVKDGLIEAIDTHEIKYPYRSASFSGLSEKESELGRWGSDKYNFSYIFELIPNLDILNDFLDLLEYSFSVQDKLSNGKLEGNYELYCFYIRGLFYKYIKNLDSNLVNKDYYYKIKDLLNKYDYKITYNFNLSDIKDKFGIDDIEEVAKEIIDNEGIDGVIKLLKENEKDIVSSIDNFNGNEEIIKYKEIIKGLEEKVEVLSIEKSSLTEKNHDYNSLKEKNIKDIDKIKKLVKEKDELIDNLNNLSKLNKELETKNINLIELLNIKNINFIIIVEGESDKILLETFFSNKLIKPFIIIGGNSYGVYLLLKNYTNKSFNIPILGIFDFDLNGVDEYKNNLNEKNGFYKIEKTHYEGRLKKHNNSNIYGLLLPVPQNIIKKQVIKKELLIKDISGLPNNNQVKIEDFGVDSKMEIEHLFYDSLKSISKEDNKKLNDFLFEKEISHGGGSYQKLKIANNQKVNFANDIKNGTFFTGDNNYHKYLFENFEPIYDIVKEIVDGKY